MQKNKVEGVLEVMPEGFGFLRDISNNFRQSDKDPLVSASHINQFQLESGALLQITVKKHKNEKYPNKLQKLLQINGIPADKYAPPQALQDGTSIDPEEKFKMNMGNNDYIGRTLDLLTPIGKGQRGMIISPPKAGKTTILKHVAQAALKNHPETIVMALLVDERPEEVTDFKRNLINAMVFHSSTDQDVASHLRITSLALNMAIQQVEHGKDVLLIIDSLTRMGRAFNKEADSGGKTLSGGLATNALDMPRRFFGAARNIEHGGSLTIIATILIETGSRMDDIIFQEFRGTGNMDLVLCRECADKRLFPAINIKESGTRKEHKLLSLEDLDESSYIRRKTADMKTPAALEYFLDYLRQN